jgi:hypothetical protein
MTDADEEQLPLHMPPRMSLYDLMEFQGITGDRMTITLRPPLDIEEIKANNPDIRDNRIYAYLMPNDPYTIHLLAECDEDIIESVISHETLHSVILRRIGPKTSARLDKAPWRARTHKEFIAMVPEQAKLLFRQIIAENRDGLT